MTIKRVFIAGAICQQCGKIDKIQRCKSDDSENYWMECIACGFRKDMEAVPKEEPPAPAPDNSERPVKFFP